MVRLGFIVEGKTEQILLESALFQQWLRQHELERVGTVIDAGGAGNLLPDNIGIYREELTELQATVVIILTDLDNNESVDSVKKQIGEHNGQIVIVAVRSIEAWFLADSTLLTQLIGAYTYFENPESHEQPFDCIQQLFVSQTGRGVGTKPMLARRMLKYGFTVENAANHPNCPSARYFLDTLKTLASAG